ncbi:hypothetical protein QNI19_08160 [Cytophagaceae bacterium DM2B3-1]|uniref:Uncharacterized protein n=2 Tax=Xanthocytophaga TaxID=3078918 RepID=A0ABT7CGN2_9BACT|nr:MULTISPECIES: hypothetical protein [Xanthocytophaga]MDJ1492901.1 hypothetical protein [Xanthocytophaga flavus]MDJ1506771.1 hypothetical protein [Xanthocytophaga agilis]
MKTIQVGQKVILRKNINIHSIEVTAENDTHSHSREKEVILKEIGEILSVVVDQHGLEWVVETNRLLPSDNYYLNSMDTNK